MFLFLIYFHLKYFKSHLIKIYYIFSLLNNKSLYVYIFGVPFLIHNNGKRYNKIKKRNFKKIKTLIDGKFFS